MTRLFVASKSGTNYKGRKSSGGRRGYASLGKHVFDGVDAQGRKANQKMELIACEGFPTNDPHEWLKMAEEAGIGKTKNPIHNGKVALPPGFKFRDQKEKEEVIQIYREAHGLQNCPYCAEEHSEKTLKSSLKEGDHLHILVSRVDPDTGKVVSDRGSHGMDKKASIAIAKHLGIDMDAYKPEGSGNYRRKDLEAAARMNWTPPQFKKLVTAAARSARTQDDFLKALEKKGVVAARSEKFKQGIVFAAKDSHGKYQSLGSFSKALNGLPDQEAAGLRKKLGRPRNFQTIKNLNKSGFRGYAAAAKPPQRTMNPAPRIAQRSSPAIFFRESISATPRPPSFSSFGAQASMAAAIILLIIQASLKNAMSSGSSEGADQQNRDVEMQIKRDDAREAARAKAEAQKEEKAAFSRKPSPAERQFIKPRMASPDEAMWKDWEFATQTGREVWWAEKYAHHKMAQEILRQNYMQLQMRSPAP